MVWDRTLSTLGAGQVSRRLFSLGKTWQAYVTARQEILAL